MSADIRLERFVQRKLSRGRDFFYFRFARRGHPEFRRPLPHPFDEGYRTAYDAAWSECFGVHPGHLINPKGWAALVQSHRDSAKFRALSANNKNLRNLALDLALERWGEFLPSLIRPVHVQAVYDSLSDRSATANRRLDDLSAVFAWGAVRGFCDVNPCRKIERVKGVGSYEPWPQWALERLFADGQPHLTRVALVAIYSGQRRGDVLDRFTASNIRNGVWYPRQGKTGTEVPVPLHPVLPPVPAPGV